MFDKAGLEDPLALAAKGEWNMAKFQEVAKKLTEANGKWGFEFKDGQGYDVAHHARADAADPRLWRRRLGEQANAASTSRRRSLR